MASFSLASLLLSKRIDLQQQFYFIIIIIIFTVIMIIIMIMTIIMMIVMIKQPAEEYGSGNTGRENDKKDITIMIILINDQLIIKTMIIMIIKTMSTCRAVWKRQHKQTRQQ